MKRALIALSATMLAIACTMQTEVADYNVVPLPQTIDLTEVTSPFTLTPRTVIAAPASDEDLTRSAYFLSEYVKQMVGYSLKVVDSAKAPEKNVITLSLAEGTPESYTIDIDPSRVSIAGADGAGVFYGVQTLRKSLPVAEGKCNVTLLAGHIADAPRFHYRGMHLDVARHMFPVEFIKKYIDVMAMHNINMLHFHITEDQGWRIEVKNYPKLQEIGAYRNGTVIGHMSSGPLDQIPCDSLRYGGYYTQDEIRDIVAYASDRHIEVMPEIDLPGHMLAALAAYPELGCTGGPYETCKFWGVFEDVLCAGNDDVYDFLFKVFDEIVPLFPCKYVHLGGDECPKDRWCECPKCQAKIKELGIKATADKTAEDQLQSYLMWRVGEHLKQYGKQIMAWDEMLEGGGVEDCTIMSWRGESGGIAASLSGHDCVMVPTGYFYFDYGQSRNPDEPLNIGGYLPVERVYSYDPEPAAIKDNPEALAHIIGVQANLWTEYITTGDYAEYMVLPRMDALSEVQWTSCEKDYPAFLGRLEKMRAIYDRLGYNYAKHIFETAE